jgi:hypothetical protein
MLSRYIEGLYKIVEQEKQERELAMQQEAASPPSVKSLEQQLVEYFRTLSHEQLQCPWTMNEIIMSGNLKGKFRDRPHPQQVAEILKRLSWKRRRTYGVNSGRYWLHPSTG